jgi:hypothetical protein
MCIIFCIVLQNISSVAAPHQIQSGLRNFTGRRRHVKPWTSNFRSLCVYCIYLNMRWECFHNSLPVKKRGGGCLIIAHKSFHGNWQPYVRGGGYLTCKVILHLGECGNLLSYAEQLQIHCQLLILNSTYLFPNTQRINYLHQILMR